MLYTQKLLLNSTYSRRTLYRHSSGMGTVICFNDGRDREVLVLDAKYRTVSNINTLSKDLPYYPCYNINGNQFLDGVNYDWNPKMHIIRMLE